MTYRGIVQNGRVKLEVPVNLPDGTPVTISLVDSPAKNDVEITPSMYERWKDIVGSAKHLPPDASVNIDEVLYGHANE